MGCRPPPIPRAPASYVRACTSEAERAVLVNAIADEVILAAGKCPACGSWEFKRHNGHRVCAYCRCAA